MSFFFHRLPNDEGVAKRMYEKFMKNPVVPLLACAALCAAFSISRRRFVKSPVEFNRSIALVPAALLAGTAAWYQTSVQEQYIRDDDD